MIKLARSATIEPDDEGNYRILYYQEAAFGFEKGEMVFMGRHITPNHHAASEYKSAWEEYREPTKGIE